MTNLKLTQTLTEAVASWRIAAAWQKFGLYWVPPSHIYKRHQQQTFPSGLSTITNNSLRLLCLTLNAAHTTSISTRSSAAVEFSLVTYRLELSAWTRDIYSLIDQGWHASECQCHRHITVPPSQSHFSSHCVYSNQSNGNTHTSGLYPCPGHFLSSPLPHFTE